MATRTATINQISTFNDKGHVVQWTGLLNGDDGSPIDLPGSTLRSVQFTGTFGTGGTIVIEGSNDGTNYVTLTDLQGNSISKTAAAIEGIQEVTRYIRPRVTGGDGATDLVATLYLGKAV
jgi:hypothetical protein